VLHGSIDEIPSARTLEALLAGEAHLPVGMEMRWCAYRPGLVHPLPWRGTVAQEWRLVGSFAGMREKRLTLPAVGNAGTRLSMLGEEPPESGRHPDGHALRETETDETWPKWVRANFSAYLPCPARPGGQTDDRGVVDSSLVSVLVNLGTGGVVVVLMILGFLVPKPTHTKALE